MCAYVRVVTQEGGLGLPYEGTILKPNIEVFNHFHRCDRKVISTNFRQQSRPSRKHKFQIVENRPADGERGKQFNSFYFRTTRRWNTLPCKVVDAETVNAFKNNLDEEWEAAPSKYASNEWANRRNNLQIVWDSKYIIITSSATFIRSFWSFSYKNE